MNPRADRQDLLSTSPGTRTCPLSGVPGARPLSQVIFSPTMPEFAEVGARLLECVKEFPADRGATLSEQSHMSVHRVENKARRQGHHSVRARDRRYGVDGAQEISGRSSQPRRALQALQHRQFEPHACTAAAGCASAGGRLSGADGRPVRPSKILTEEVSGQRRSRFHRRKAQRRHPGIRCRSAPRPHAPLPEETGAASGVHRRDQSAIWLKPEGGVMAGLDPAIWCRDGPY